MAEAWRKEEPLTTADLAGTRTRFNAATPTPEPDREALGARKLDSRADLDARGNPESTLDGGPRLVRNEAPAEARADIRNEQRDRSADAAGAVSTETPRNSGGIAGRDTEHELPATTSTPLLADAELTDLRSRWTDIQAGFVDEPRESVEQADQLVASAIQRLAEAFARERASLESQWESGSNVSTEDLRLALQRYRSFFGRLLNAA